MRSMLLLTATCLLLAGCPKDAPPAPTPSTSNEPDEAAKLAKAMKKSKETEKKLKEEGPPAGDDEKAAASTEASAGAAGDAPVLTPAAYCDALVKLAPAKPSPTELSGCVADANKRKTQYPDRYACESRCLSMSTELDTAKSCHSMCNDPEAVCGQVSAPTKSACVKRLGKFMKREVEAKDYACFAKCIAKSPEDATGLQKTIDCLGTDCKL